VVLTTAAAGVARGGVDVSVDQTGNPPQFALILHANQPLGDLLGGGGQNHDVAAAKAALILGVGLALDYLT
jgi:hypothetical protein